MQKSLTALFLIMLFSASSFATVSLSSLRSLYMGTPIALPAGTIISGTIISDRSALNLPDHSAFIQDNTGGMDLRFDLICPFNLGDSVVIDVSGDSLMEYNGLLEINYIALAGATLAGTGTIVPQTVTVADILNNMGGSTDTWESTLVTVNNATITNASTGTYSGSDTIHDATGDIVLFTRSLAVFAADPLPAGLVNITGYISDFNLPEFIIRNINDVQIVSSVYENTGENTNVIVFPNPASDHLTIITGRSKLKFAASITDITGKIIYTGAATGNQKLDVNIKDFPEGVYAARIKTEDFVEMKKFLVVK